MPMNTEAVAELKHKLRVGQKPDARAHHARYVYFVVVAQAQRPEAFAVESGFAHHHRFRHEVLVYAVPVYIGTVPVFVGFLAEEHHKAGNVLLVCNHQQTVPFHYAVVRPGD